LTAVASWFGVAVWMETPGGSVMGAATSPWATSEEKTSRPAQINRLTSLRAFGIGWCFMDVFIGDRRCRMERVMGFVDLFWMSKGDEPHRTIAR